MTGPGKMWIQTRSGQRFDLVHPTSAMVVLDDIAHALSLMNRYTGHTVMPYSVAQHSIFVALHVSDNARPYALLHDAEEAYTGDLSSPMKCALRSLSSENAYGALTDGIRKAIFRRFGLQYPPPPKLWEEVKKADWLALSTEKRDLLEHDLSWHDWEIPKPVEHRLMPMSWHAAKLAFSRMAARVGIR